MMGPKVEVTCRLITVSDLIERHSLKYNHLFSCPPSYISLHAPTLQTVITDDNLQYNRFSRSLLLSGPAP